MYVCMYVCMYADHSTLLFLPGFFFYKIRNFFFLLRVNLYMITNTYLHDPPSFNGPFFMTPPFSAVSKSCDSPSVSTLLPSLPISDKSLSARLLKDSAECMATILTTDFLTGHLRQALFHRFVNVVRWLLYSKEAIVPIVTITGQSQYSQPLARY